MPDTEQSLIDTPGIPEVELLVDVLNAPEIVMQVEVSGMTKTEVDKTLSIEDCAADAKATGQAIANVAAALADYEEEVDSRTAADIPYDDSQSPNSIQEEIEEVALDLHGQIEEVSGDVQSVADDLSGFQTDVYDLLYPIGSIYFSNSAIAPNFPGTYWVEVVKSATVAQIKAGTTGYTQGTGAGPVHYWLRTTEPEPEPEEEGGDGT